MQRAIYLVLFGVVLVLPFIVRAALLRREARPASRGETLVIITPHNQDIRREFERAFSAWHLRRYGSAVDIDYRTPGGTNDINRQLKSTYDGYRDRRTRALPPDVPADIHIVWGGGDYPFENELKPAGILQPMRLDPRLLREAFPEPALAGVRLYEGTTDASGAPMPLWVGVCLSGFGIVYNEELYVALDLPAPRSWGDLTHEKLAGLVALADPVHSGSASVAYLMVVQRRMADAEEAFFAKNPELRSADKATLAGNADYRSAIAAGWKRGMAELVLIVANSRYFTDSSSQVPNDVGHGQAAAGMAIDFYGRVFQETVGASRCRVVLPRAATAITPDPVAILWGVKGRQLELALHFVEFLLSPEGQRLWILKVGVPGGPVERVLRRSPIRRDVYADKTGWADDLDPFALAGGFNQRAEWGALFADMRLVWAAAWVDSRDALRSAYAKVLRVKNPVQRKRLAERLADLPITLAEVEAMRNERKRLEKEGGADEWKAAKRIELVKRFRAHYARVGRGAEAWGPGGSKTRKPAGAR